MVSFLVSLLVLVIGYFVYGAFCERVFGVDSSRKTPAITQPDGIDYIAMPWWRLFLIQFLNIAGLGPIFGAVMGIVYGPSAFIWIVLGTLFAGAMHDFLAGMISIREGGASLPEIVGQQLGLPVKQLMRGVSVFLLILVGAVFVSGPADLLTLVSGDMMPRMGWVVAIFVYYLLASLLPIDKLIGRIYPIFGVALLFMAAGVLVSLFVYDAPIVELTQMGEGSHPNNLPIFPMMFVSIACGAISGFHATQSPMMARCMTNEKYGRRIFYGAMVTEGIVALIWAAAASSFYGSIDGLNDALAQNGNNAAVIVDQITTSWLGGFGSLLAMLGVVFAPITSGDTALRSVRLMIADIFKMEQKSISSRLMITIPVFAATLAILQLDFSVLWRYFAWSNQTLAVFTLWAITVYLSNRGKAYIISLIPALFMSMVCITYICYAPEGLALGYNLSVGIAALVSMLFLVLFMKNKRKNYDNRESNN